MHLTNYSVNRQNEAYVHNTSTKRDDQGHKWSLAALNEHLEKVGINMNLLWSRIYGLIIKTLICHEPQVQAGIKEHGLNRTNCFELLGFDILIDSDLKPWLIEVNANSSLRADSPLDLAVKSTLLTDTLNLIGIQKSP